MNDFVNSTQKIVVEANFKDYELSFHHKRRHDELTQKVTCRKRLRATFSIDRDLGLTKENVLEKMIGVEVFDYSTIGERRDYI